MLTYSLQEDALIKLLTQIPDEEFERILSANSPSEFRETTESLSTLYKNREHVDQFLECQSRVDRILCLCKLIRDGYDCEKVFENHVVKHYNLRRMGYINLEALMKLSPKCISKIYHHLPISRRTIKSAGNNFIEIKLENDPRLKIS